MKKIKELESLILYHDHKYWVEENAEISDFDYDKIVLELSRLDPSNHIINRINTPTVSSKGKVKHLNPMLSLQKKYSDPEVYEWVKGISRSIHEKFTIMYKMDGCTGEYEHKILSTRGDGEYGENISHYIPMLNVLSKKYCGPLIDCNEDVRGEIVISKKDFAENQDILTRKNGECFKVERSAVAGMLNNDKPKKEWDKLLALVEFDYYSVELTSKEMKSFDWKKFIEKGKNSFEYQIDGLVIKLSDEEYGKSLGNTSHHPRSACALKLGNPTGDTTLEDVEWSVGKNCISPVGIIKEVEIEGILNKRISLHNMSYIESNDIKIGDKIRIERAGEIIPQYFEHIEKPKNRKSIEITHCPVCKSKVLVVGPEIVCSNKNCEGVIIKKLADSVVRINIERLGEPTIIKIIKTHGITDLVGILNLTLEDILELEGFKEKSAKNLFNEISKVKESLTPDWRILSSLNIHGIGQSMSKKLLSIMTLDELLDKTNLELMEIDGIGPERSITIAFDLKFQKTYLQTLRVILKEQITKKNDNDDQAPQRTVSFTGKNENPRKYWIVIAESKNIYFDKTFKKTTDILVTHDPDSSSSKMKKARSYGTKIMSYEDFSDYE